MPRRPSLDEGKAFTLTFAALALLSTTKIISAGRSVGIKKLSPTFIPSNGKIHSGSGIRFILVQQFVWQFRPDGVHANSVIVKTLTPAAGVVGNTLTLNL